MLANDINTSKSIVEGERKEAPSVTTPPTSRFSEEEYPSIELFVNGAPRESLEEKVKKIEQRNAEETHQRLNKKTEEYIRQRFKFPNAYIKFITNLESRYQSEKNPDLKQKYLLELIINYTNLLIPAKRSS